MARTVPVAFGRAVVVAVSAALLLLALLALDDITTGNEPSLWMEYTVVLAAAAWFGGLLAFRLRGRHGAAS